ncbi:HD domain-containing phosphohydrolase [Accumulibacter sp.]|uniref:HD-GYP domain-containing protein n=1 Tax=Accumulibacter sp. TaxID=2053492 RepID=UPI0025E2006E|nr:HD domain-containing phosphohydrolase [Accumulibacter sp.]MCM8614136.1 HD domain-containing protein [Accumulibacter sp.]MCM8637903.1 HD domain-containing protein [Accumulibacter sp.]MCM8640529.1 HD domain-containing protein [Accumulibacter sp.]
MASILIIDDRPEDLLTLERTLGADHRLRLATSLQQALQPTAGEPHADLILLQATMAAPDRHPFVGDLPPGAAIAGTPVIVISSGDRADDETWLERGADDCLPRPLRPALVAARVRLQLELQAARKRLLDQDRSLAAEVERRLADNLMIQDVSIRALARLAEVRDPETGDHLRRTQRYVRTLAEELGSHRRFAAFLTPANTELLAKSAPLHDIGKVGIRDEILLKPGRLTAEEREIMKAHSLLGFQAIQQAEQDSEQPVDFLQMAKEITRSHHEKWDGSGYPDGLAGDEIPIAARLMALADVFDALIAARVYKRPFPFEQAGRMIREGRGSHFDPDIVDAFVAREADFMAIACDNARARPLVAGERQAVAAATPAAGRKPGGSR